MTDELNAVISHEMYHKENRDPLNIFSDVTLFIHDGVYSDFKMV